jgi:hypothetical protein
MVDFVGCNEYHVAVVVDDVVMVVARDYSFERVVSSIDTIELRMPDLEREVPKSVKAEMTKRLRTVDGYPTFL